MREAHDQPERLMDFYTAAQAYKDGLVDDYLKDMDVSAIEDALNVDTDTLANIIVINRGKSNLKDLIMQQIESSLLNAAETAIDEEYS